MTSNLRELAAKGLGKSFNVNGTLPPNYEEMFWEKFDSLVDKSGECWVWLGGSHDGRYGTVRYRGGSRAVHRLSYTRSKGKIPVGLVLDHLCRNTRCVRPDHLEAVTNKENIRRGTGVAALNAAKTECSRGHPLSGDNLHVDKRTGDRICRACLAFHKEKRITALNTEVQRLEAKLAVAREALESLKDFSYYDGCVDGVWAIARKALEKIK
jgi:uncharacterized small protein (DUF1192 family)